MPERCLLPVFFQQYFELKQQTLELRYREIAIPGLLFLFSSQVSAVSAGASTISAAPIHIHLSWLSYQYSIREGESDNNHTMQI